MKNKINSEEFANLCDQVTAKIGEPLETKKFDPYKLDISPEEMGVILHSLLVVIGMMENAEEDKIIFKYSDVEYILENIAVQCLYDKIRNFLVEGIYNVILG